MAETEACFSPKMPNQSSVCRHSLRLCDLQRVTTDIEFQFTLESDSTMESRISNCTDVPYITVRLHRDRVCSTFLHWLWHAFLHNLIL